MAFSTEKIDLESSTMKKKSKLSNPPQHHQTETHILELPDHLMVMIFSQIPFPTLFQCRCVCKSWRRWLSQLHFAKCLFSHTPPSLLIKRRHALFLLDQRNDVVIKLAQDPYTRSSSIQIVGSCNGFIVARHNDAQFYMSNPIIGDFLNLPMLSWKINGTYGFGFSPVSNVYKLVAVSIPYRGVEEAEVMVLTIGSDFWRSIGSCVYPRWVPSSGVYLSGFLHWIVGFHKLPHQHSFAILAFDVDTECFQELPMPPCDFNLSVVEMELGALNGCLTLNVGSRSKIVCWVMKDYGVGESWIKEFEIRSQFRRDTFFNYPTRSKVLNLTEKGHVLLLRGHELEAYTPGARGYVKIEVDRIPELVHEACVHIPSFLSLQGVIPGLR